jgi:hypothetical protein
MFSGIDYALSDASGEQRIVARILDPPQRRRSVFASPSMARFAALALVVELTRGPKLVAAGSHERPSFRRGNDFSGTASLDVPLA